MVPRILRESRTLQPYRRGAEWTIMSVRVSTDGRKCRHLPSHVLPGESLCNFMAYSMMSTWIDCPGASVCCDDVMAWEQGVAADGPDKGLCSLSKPHATQLQIAKILVMPRGPLFYGRPFAVGEGRAGGRARQGAALAVQAAARRPGPVLRHAQGLYCHSFCGVSNFHFSVETSCLQTSLLICRMCRHSAQSTI